MKNIKQHNSLFLAFLVGTIFFAFNSWYSYDFYHVNSFKLAYMGLMLILLFIIYDLGLVTYYKIFKRETIEQFQFPWKEALLYLGPVLATFPGYFLNLSIPTNYNFSYELATRIIVLLWLVYMMRAVRSDKQIITFLVIVGSTMIYIWFFGVLERYGLSPFADYQAANRIKVTYGNINYLAGSLVPIIPLFLTLSFASFRFNTAEQNNQYKEIIFKNKFLYFFFFFCFLASFHTLILTQTKAAIAAGILSTLLAVSFLLWTFVPEKKKKLFALIISGGLVLVVIALFLVVIYHKEILPFVSSRFFEVANIETWYGRVISWLPTLYAFFDAPIFGFGIGSSYNLFFIFLEPDTRLLHNQRSYNHAHSEWLEFLGEGGILGYLFFFILWGYVFYHGIKLFFHPKVTIFHKRILIGSLCGMLGFHMHALFSVSQRMVVTNIPQYALLAIAFGLIAFYHSKFAIDNKTPQKWLQNIKNLGNGFNQKWLQIPAWCRNQLPCLILIILGFTLYYSWVKTQYDYVAITKKGKSYLRTLELEKLLKKRKDIYALDNLLRWQIEYRQFDKALKTIETIENIIPNYRSTGFLKALTYYHKRDIKKAHEIIKEYRDYDNYFLPSLRLALNLAIYNQDKDDFLLNLGYVAKLYNSKYNNRRYDKSFHNFNFKVVSDQTKDTLIKASPDNLDITVSFSKGFFNNVIFPLTQRFLTTNNRNIRNQIKQQLLSIYNSQLLVSAFNDGYIKIETASNKPTDIAKIHELIQKGFIAKGLINYDLNNIPQANVFKDWPKVRKKIAPISSFLHNYAGLLR